MCFTYTSGGIERERERERARAQGFLHNFNVQEWVSDDSERPTIALEPRSTGPSIRTVPSSARNAFMGESTTSGSHPTYT